MSPRDHWPPVRFAEEGECRTVEKDNNELFKNSDYRKPNGDGFYTRANCIEAKHLGHAYNTPGY